MVKFTEQERDVVRAVWEKVDVDEIGPEALIRVLITYPWTERYFGKFGDLFSISAVSTNAKLAEHGKVVLRSLGRAVEDMDNIKKTYAELSRLHCEKIHVDPDNFRLLADCITITIACKLKSTFNSNVQATWQKFLTAVVEAMTSQYN
ncbi:hemoglobin cathodic subunit beta-like [Solea senegalensis]|uniref:Hemoglobin cathodic subunit beta-like n=1 Tax=Solea senegalensis TaxID=28829 RepID=A0AAV6RL95_SOLSE|nr:hemoglobin cathodic subunit beta-like [Solea senegalensis]KAG7505760.1 hemoglobin cathodic subunit beta-like [Solea senegalensis]